MEDLDISLTLLSSLDVVRYVTDVMTPEQVAAGMQNVTRRGAGGRLGVWCVERKDTGEKIGDGVLTPIPIDEDDTPWDTLVPEAYPEHQIEVGDMLVPSAWGQGFATEICERLLKFAFDMTSLDEIVACTDPENAASQRVLVKSGLRDCGTGYAYREDVSWFEITRLEWMRLTASD